MKLNDTETTTSREMNWDSIKSPNLVSSSSSEIKRPFKQWNRDYARIAAEKLFNKNKRNE